ncbi:hypothetical protein SAMN05216357_1335 [Porphyromonadaceae bacterium KH3CP3RA]|nr:hypothetical protein SAMN05216357_1335 [Porphyromonadaceae bacterium KH3CP3RA]
MGKKGQKWMKTIRKSIKNLVLWLIDRGIKVLSKTELKLTKDNNPNPWGYEDLTPTHRGDEDKKYSKVLEWALKNTNIKNIALTGSYGSGKSSIIKTFTKEHKEYNILNITLASFSDKDIEDNKDINRLIELSILQQMFYHVKHKQIPDSRFKRIRNLRVRNIIFKSFLFIIWLLATIAFFKPTFVTTFILWQEYDLNNNRIVSIIALCIFILGITYAISKTFRIANNSKLNKLNVQSGEIEISHDVDSSILNKHLDEILYFFEVTKFEIVIIEDLDRFNNTEIFTKLRELNILVNHSKQVNKRIVFLYAIKDDMFQDKNRTKFFDFIIPVIPIINTSNSGEKLLDKFRETKLITEDESRDSLSIEFINDVSMYIDDMRLLKNIYNEYVVYKEKLDPKLNQNNLLAMIIYKNIFPSDFADLHNDKGKVFSIFSNKKELIQNRINKINEDIKEAREKIQLIENVSVKDIEELRSIYIETILEKIPTARSLVINDTEYQFGQLKEDDNFSSLRECSTIQYNSLEPYHNYRYRDTQYQITTVDSNFNFEAIESSVDSKQTYEKREKLIIERDNNKVESLKQKIERLEKEKHYTRSWTMVEISENFDISNFVKDIIEKEKNINNLQSESLTQFSEKEKLIIYLIRNGYLNENYHDYISYFYEGLITKDDRDFLFSIKNRDALDFKFKLTKIENLLKKIKPKEFEYKETLNCSLLDYFLANKTKHRDQYQALLAQICNKSRASILFIDTFLSEGINVDLFIQDICKKWQSFWQHLTMTDYSEEKKDIYLKAIITYLDINELKQQDVKSSLSNYIAGKSNFLSFVSGMDEEKINSMLLELNVKFSNLSQPEEGNKVFDFIYENNLYKINYDMVKLFVVTKGRIENVNMVETENYSTIISSGTKPLIKYINDNIQVYISYVFLQIPENTKESEESILFLLNNDGIKTEDRKKIIDTSENKIMELSSITNQELREYLINHSKVAPTWENIILYYSSTEKTIDSALVSFFNIEENYSELSKTKLNEDDETVNNFIDSFITTIAISDISFEKIMLSNPFVYSGLDFQNLSERKVSIMIGDLTLQTSPERFLFVKENFAGLHIKLLERQPNKFIEELSDYTFDSNDISQILQSSKLGIEQKILVIQNTDKALIIAHEELSNIVCELLSKHNPIGIDSDLFTGLIRNIRSINNKIRLINTYFDSFDEGIITESLTLLGDPYSEIVNRGKKPSIPNNAATLTLVQKLQSNNYISSFKEKEEKIKIYTFNR